MACSLLRFGNTKRGGVYTVRLVCPNLEYAGAALYHRSVNATVQYQICTLLMELPLAEHLSHFRLPSLYS